MCHTVTGNLTLLLSIHNAAAVVLRKLQTVTAVTSTSDIDKMYDREKKF